MPASIKKPIKQTKLSDVIQQQLETLILDGTLSAGEKLPSERDLAKQFEVSRPSLREAIQKLETKNLVVRRQGGGTFVSDKILSGFSNPLFDMLSKSDDSQFDLLEFRLGMEGMSAYYAAKRGTKADYEEIQKQFDHIGVVQIENDIRVEAQAVFDLFMSICAASHNAVILHLARGMSDLLIDNIEQNLTLLAKRPDIFAQVSDYRKRLFAEIINGQPQRAWAASHRHLVFIEEELMKITQENTRIEKSIRRIKH